MVLEGINFSKNTTENIRKIFLTRTAEILNSFNADTDIGMVKNDDDR